MSKTIKSKLISLFAVLLSICMLFSVASLVTSTAKAESTTTAATLVEGASVRVTSSESSGLKFKAQLDKAQYNELFNKAGGKLKAGMIIVPTDLIPASGYTFNDFATAGKTVASNTIEQFKDGGSTYEFTMSIVNLKLANYDRDFEAIVYLESEVALDGFTAYGEKYYAYAERNVDYARNIYEVAKGVYNDRAAVQDDVKYVYPVNGKYATLDADGLAIAKTFIDGVTEIVLDNGKPAAYSSEYYAAKGDVLTNDTEAYLLGEHKNVVYKGESISAPFTADGITIKEMYTARATYANGEYTTAGYANSGDKYNQWGGVGDGAGTYGYVAFDGAYGANTYVEVTFKGANMPNVMLFADDVTVETMAANNLATGNVPTANTNKGLIGINGMTQNGAASGAAPTSPQFAFQVYAPYRMHGHFPGNSPSNADRWASGLPSIGGLINAGADVEYRAVIGTYVKYEDVHNASGVIYGAEEQKDGILEDVLYYDFDLYNASTGASLKSYDFILQPAKALNTVDSKYILASDMEAGSIMLFSALLGADANGEVIDSTFKVTKAPYHVHNYNSEVQSDATHHWYECACGAAGEKAEHFGGTATHTEKAKCEVCLTPYGDYRANYDVDGVTLYNMSNMSAPELISKTKGQLTFTATSTNWSGQTAAIGIDEVYDDEFVKVGFTALAGDGTALNSSTASQLGVGFRRAALDGASINSGWAAFGYDGGYGIFYGNKAANSLHAGNGSYLGVGTPTNLKFVAGEQYYMVVGVTGTAPAEGETDNRTMYIFYLDSEENLIGGMGFTMARFVSTRADATMAESGYFTIHSWATEERTLTYEIISGSQAAYYMNGGKGVEGLAVSGNTASWTAYNGATSYKVKVDNGEWTDVGNVTSYAIPNITAFNTYNVTVKAVCAGFETKETTTQFTYVPSGITLVNVDSIKADESTTATSGKVTVTADSASAIGFAADATDFIKVKFAATGAAVEAMAINFRQASVTANWQSGWGIVPNGSHGMMLNYGGNYYMNRINGHGLYTNVIAGEAIEAKSDFVEGNEYAYMFGITGTGTDKVLHFMIIDETNETIMRYVTWTWAQVLEYAGTLSKDLSDKAIAESGAFVFNFTDVVTDRTISYEIIEAADVFKNANYGAIANVKATGATVSWDAVAGVNEYLVSVNGGAYETVNTNSYTIANPVAFANYEVVVKANKGYYASTGSLSFNYMPANMSTINVAEISGNATATNGNITIKSSIESGIGWQNTTAFSLDQQFTNEFIKIGFTALSGDGSAINLYDAMGFEVGFRRSSTAQTNPVLNDWMFKANNDSNYGYFYNKSANAFAYGHGADSLGDKAKLKLVAGEQYYFVLGVAGAVEGETDNRTMYAFWLDADSKLIGGINVTMTKFVSKNPNGSMDTSGGMSIHSYVPELNVSYEIIDSATALGYLG